GHSRAGAGGERGGGPGQPVSRPHPGVRRHRARRPVLCGRGRDPRRGKGRPRGRRRDHQHGAAACGSRDRGAQARPGGEGRQGGRREAQGRGGRVGGAARPPLRRQPGPLLPEDRRARRGPRHAHHGQADPLRGERGRGVRRGGQRVQRQGGGVGRARGRRGRAPLRQARGRDRGPRRGRGRGVPGDARPPDHGFSGVRAGGLPAARAGHVLHGRGEGEPGLDRARGLDGADRRRSHPLGHGARVYSRRGGGLGGHRRRRLLVEGQGVGQHSPRRPRLRSEGWRHRAYPLQRL
ncbi:MAG: GTP-binding and nucleic acid-binding protein YchF, partial [uncultured Rubrobacteraceae bacterium]